MIDDPLPGDPGPGRKGGHSVTDHAGRAAADDLRDLPIGSHFAWRDPADSLVDLPVPGDVSTFHSSNLLGFRKKCNPFCLEEKGEVIEVDMPEFVRYKKNSNSIGEKRRFPHGRFHHGFNH